MTFEQYQTRAQAIETWAEAQCAAGKPSNEVERAVERKYAVLDAEYESGPCYAQDLRQSRADVDAECDHYPGWTAMQSALRYND